MRRQSLYGVRHKAKHAYRPDVRDFYKLFFLCDEAICEHPHAGMKTLDAAFFPHTALPPLSTGRVLQRDILDAFEFAGNGLNGGAAFFD
jgi:hypothetical protein